jgi:TonB family protein
MTDAATFYPREFYSRDPMRGSFIAALTLHLAIVGTIVASAWLRGHSEPFGAPDAGGGAVVVEAVNTIPLPQHHGEQNPLASDTESEVPQAPSKPIDRVKEEVVKPDAIRLKAKPEKAKKAEKESQHQRFRPYDQLATNQLTSRTAPQVSNPMYKAQNGAGSVSPGAHTTLGVRLAGYAAQIQDIVASHWRTSDIDARVQSAPQVIATFELMRDGSIRNVQILQGSNISALDISVKRAILDSAPFPPIPLNQGFDKDYAKVEFTFELKR